MAKLKAPLFSFSAAGKLADSLVYFAWKGIDCVRQYVIPANPDTAAQSTQRDILKAAVAEWHLSKYTAADKTAWDVYAAIQSKPMSGFNAFVKMWIAIVRDVLAIVNPPWTCYLNDAGAGKFDAGLQEDGEASSAYFIWGYSKTALNTTIALAEAPANNWTIGDVAAISGKTVYGRFKTNAGDHSQGYSGIRELIIT